MNHRTSTHAAHSAARRRLTVALLAAAAGWAGLPSPAGSAGPALPQRNLVVEARVVESSAFERQAVAGGGAVVVGSGGGTLPAGAAGVRAGTDSRRNDSVQRVLVLNGGRATLRLSQWIPLRSAEWVWIGHGLGVGGSTVWVDIGQGLAVRPAWPGGNQPARVEIAIESAGRNDARGATQPDATAPRLAVSTELSMPLGEWVSVGQVFDDSSGTSAGVGVGGRGVGGDGVTGIVSSTRSLRRELGVQLRITAP